MSLLPLRRLLRGPPYPALCSREGIALRVYPREKYAVAPKAVARPGAYPARPALAGKQRFDGYTQSYGD